MNIEYFAQQEAKKLREAKDADNAAWCEKYKQHFIDNKELYEPIVNEAIAEGLSDDATRERLTTAMEWKMKRDLAVQIGNDLHLETERIVKEGMDELKKRHSAIAFASSIDDVHDYCRHLREMFYDPAHYKHMVIPTNWDKDDIKIPSAIEQAGASIVKPYHQLDVPGVESTSFKPNSEMLYFGGIDPIDSIEDAVIKTNDSVYLNPRRKGNMQAQIDYLDKLLKEAYKDVPLDIPRAKEPESFIDKAERYFAKRQEEDNQALIDLAYSERKDGKGILAQVIESPKTTNDDDIQ